MNDVRINIIFSAAVMLLYLILYFINKYKR